MGMSGPIPGEGTASTWGSTRITLTTPGESAEAARVRRSTLLRGAALAAAVSFAMALTPAASASSVTDDDTREPVVSAAPSAHPPTTPNPVAAQAQGSTRYQAALAPSAVPAAITASLTLTARASRYLGPALSGQVVEIPQDSADGVTVQWRHNAGRTRLPASTQKVLTAYTVLHSMKPTDRLTTTVYQNTVKRDRLYLRGGADPSLTRSRLASLARDTAAALKRQKRTRVAVYVDASVLPRPTSASGWKSSYLRSDVQRVQGLPLAGYRGTNAATAAGRLFAAYLSRYAIRATMRTAATTPAVRWQLARSTSAPVRSLVATMLATSNNDYAEFLLRHAAIARGVTPTWSGAIGNEVTLLRAARVPLGGLRLADGSGLSRTNRMPVATLTAVLTRLWTDPADAKVVFAWGAMPRAGQSGTLVKRFRIAQQACAQGLVLAKTGTLADTVALAGVARSVDGRDRVFVLIENGITGRNTSVRMALDTLATSVVGCRLG